MARDRVNNENGEPFACRVPLISSPVADAMCALIIMHDCAIAQSRAMDRKATKNEIQSKGGCAVS